METPAAESKPSTLATLMLIFALTFGVLGVVFVASMSDEYGDSGCGGG